MMCKFRNLKNDVRQQYVCNAIHGWYAFANKGLTLPFQSPPCITIGEYRLLLEQSGHIDLTPLIALIPQIPTEWEFIRSNDCALPMEEWPLDNKPNVISVMSYLESRCHNSKTNLSTHFFIDFRNSVLRVLVYLFEHAINSELQVRKEK